MYLKKILLENVGPIEKIDFELPFNSDGNPKPLILVGENGTGKSIFLSFVVNALVSARQSIGIENTEVEKGKVYKYRSPTYIRTGSIYYLATLLFQDDLKYTELQLDTIKSNLIESELQLLDGKEGFSIMDNNKSSVFNTNFNSKIKELYSIDNTNVMLYYPANRYEDPAWLNINNLNSKAEYQDLIYTADKTNRNIIIHSNLKQLKNWFFDIFYDDFLTRKTRKGVDNGGTLEIRDVLEPRRENSIYGAILRIFSIIFNHKFTEPNFIFGNRNDRTVEIYDGKEPVCPNIFNLSTGETLLIDLFFSILRDFDLTGNGYIKPEEIKGIVIIDEVDLHLHSNLQKEVLPKLIKLFPKVQFIITTHSPLFVLGMEDTFGVDGIQIREMPNGDIITAERFKEFETAFKYFSETKTFEEKLENNVKSSEKEYVLFVEGESDKTILQNAWNKLYPTESMNFDIISGFDRFFIGNTFLRGDVYRNSNKTFIGMLDFDDAFENYKKLGEQKINNIKTHTEIESSEINGLTLKNNNNRGYLFLLPVPEFRKVYASRKQKMNSCLSIEFLFRDELLNGCLEEKEGPMGIKIPKFKDDKKNEFADKTINFNSDDFENFLPIFEKIKNIIN